MQRFLLFLLFAFSSLSALAQSSALRGLVKDENGNLLGSAPVVLLFPVDSTLAFFGVTNEQGLFEIKNIKTGKYILQVTMMGHQTLFRDVAIPLTIGDNIGSIILKSTPVRLSEVVVARERIPMKFKRDTIEFNTAAFPTKPDAVVEDLLKKLPGIDIDRAGNIKAMGEDVKKVLVDGREFFGSDPKLATRNVPADALKKVQIFDKKSEESEFTGIDDGTRDKTLNLLLKEDRKKAIFGELLGGLGNTDHYQGSGKVYKFTDKNQFAVLGMLNNINQFGFSFKDYIDFNGGLQNFGGHSGAVQIRLPDGGNSFPVNFGQPVTGLSTSGAAGFNFSRQFKKDSRVFMSYIANGSDRKLSETTSTRNFTGADWFQQMDSLLEQNRDRAHRLNFGFRDRIDSTRNIIVNGSASLSSGRTESNSSAGLFDKEELQNNLLLSQNNKANQFTGNLNGSYMKIFNRGKSVFRLASDGSFSQNVGNLSWLTDTYLLNSIHTFNNQFQDNKEGLKEFSATSSFTFRAAKNLYAGPELKAGEQIENLSRTQGIPSDSKQRIDSLSPDFSSKYRWFRPEIKLIRNTEKIQFSIGFQAEIGKTSNSLNSAEVSTKPHFFFLPDLSWEYEYKTGRRLRAYFGSMVNVPSISQLLPVVNYSNPLVLTSGNRYLKPERAYNLSLNWWIFDQFSFTSLLTDLNATYTINKINWDRNIDENFVQRISLINVSDDYRLRGSAAFSTPVRSLGIKINANVAEGWNRGLSYVNDIENINTNLSHKFSLSIENRRKTKIDIIAGGSFQVTDARFSIQENLNNKYVDFSYFTEIQYNPDKHWNFQLSANVSKYSSQSFRNSITIPLIGTEVSYYFLKNNRGTLSLQGSDLLNRNTGIERTSELNFLKEKRSNMLGRFFMLSFKFKLNKFGEAPGGVDIKLNKR